MVYYVYMLLCDDGSYYTGYAKNVEVRFRQHKRGLGARYTQMHKPKKIVYVEKFWTRRDAMHREKAIKQLSRSEKRNLVRSARG
ncbi:MAG: GIY-YIG nuclease family protein [Candidatus Bathyarchaeia archaeon]